MGCFCMQKGHRKDNGTQKAQAVQELRQKYPLKLSLQLAKLPRSTFYYYLHRSKKPSRYQMAKEKLVAIFNKNKKRYGYRRITQEFQIGRIRFC